MEPQLQKRLASQVCYVPDELPDGDTIKKQQIICGHDIHQPFRWVRSGRPLWVRTHRGSGVADHASVGSGVVQNRKQSGTGCRCGGCGLATATSSVADWKNRECQLWWTRSVSRGSSTSCSTTSFTTNGRRGGRKKGNGRKWHLPRNPINYIIKPILAARWRSG